MIGGIQYKLMNNVTYNFIPVHWPKGSCGSFGCFKHTPHMDCFYI